MIKPRAIHFILALLLCAVVARAQTPEATITGLRGTAAIERGGETVPAALNMELFPGDVIRTAADGMAVLLFRDGTTTKMNVDTDLTIHERLTDEEVDAILGQGEIWSLVAPKNEAMKVRTPSAVMTVRGTEILLLARGGKTTLTVVEGKVDFANEHGAVFVTGGQESVAKPGRAPSPPQTVDYRLRLRWTADIQSVGLIFEHPLTDTPPDRLAALIQNLEGKPDAGAQLGAALADAGRTARALEQLALVLEKNADDPEANRFYAYVLLETGELEEAQKHFEKALSLNDKDADSQLGLGLIHLRKNDLDTAAAEMEKALALDDRFHLARVGLAVVAMRRGDAGVAVEQLEKAAADKDAPYQAPAYLALVHLAANRTEQARDAAAKAVAAAPQSPMALCAQAKVMFFDGAYGAARDNARHALAVRPMSAFPHGILSDVFLVEHQIDDALREALTAAALDENNAFVYASLARVQDAAANYSGAVRSYEKALALDPNFLKARTDYAMLLARLNRFDDARAQVQTILDKNPDSAPAYATLGDVAFETGHVRQAGEAYRKSTELDPSLAYAHAGLSRVNIRQGKLQPALESAYEAIKLEPDNPWHYVDLGYIHDQTYSLDSAALNYRRALTLDPENPLAHAYLARQLLTGTNTSSFDNIKRGWGVYNKSVLLDPGVLYRESRRGHFTADYLSGGNRTRKHDVMWTFQEDDTKLSWNLRSYQYQTDGARENNKFYQNVNDLWLGYEQDWRRTYGLKISTFRQVRGLPGSTIGAAGQGDSDDREYYTRSSAEFSHLFRISPKNVLRFRVNLPAPFADSNELNDYAYSGPASHVYYLVYVKNATQKFDLKFDHREVSHEFKWNKRHTFQYGFARFDDRFYSTTYGWALPAAGQTDARPTVTHSAQKQNLFVAYAVDTWRINDRVELKGMVRRDSSNAEGRQTGYRASLTWKIGNRTVVHALAGQALGVYYIPYYVPQDYWSLIDRHTTTIRAARGTGYEFDIEHTFPDNSFLKLTLFQYNNREHTLMNPDNYLYSTRQQGYRVSYERRLGARTTMLWDYRYVPKRYRDPAYLMDKNYVPDQVWKSTGLFLTHLRGNGLGLHGSCIYDSEIYADAQNYIRRPDHTYCDARVFYDRNDRLRLYMSVLNVTDEDMEFSPGYPEPGRTWLFGVQQFY